SFESNYSSKPIEQKDNKRYAAVEKDRYSYLEKDAKNTSNIVEKEKSYAVSKNKSAIVDGSKRESLDQPQQQAHREESKPNCETTSTPREIPAFGEKPNFTEQCNKILEEYAPAIMETIKAKDVKNS